MRIFLAVMMSILSLLLPVYAHAAEAVDGRIDLGSVNLDKDTVTLNGSWEFYWGQLLTSDEIRSGAGKMTGYIPVTKTWGSNFGNTSIPLYGAATYRLLVNSGRNEDKLLMLKLDNIRMASRVYCNGQLAGNCGTPALDKPQYKARNVPYMLSCYSRNGKLEIIIQVANYTDDVGGIRVVPVIGTPGSVMNANVRDILFDSSVFVFFAVLALFMLCLFGLLPKEPGFIYFAVICASNLVILMLNNSRAFTALIGTWEWRSLWLLNVVAAAVQIIAFNHFVSAFKNGMLNRRLVLASDAICVVFLMLYFVNPTEMFIQITKYFETYTVLWWLVLAVIVILRTYKGENRKWFGGTLIFLSVLCMIVPKAGVLIVLYKLGKGTGVADWLPMMLFALISLLYFAYRYAYEYKGRMKFANKSVVSETAFLHSQIKPHFLFNTLSSITLFCLTDGKRAAVMLTKLSNYLRKRFDIDDSVMFTPLREELDLVRAYVEIEQARYEERVSVVYNVDETLLDIKIIPYSIQPLVENAIMHGAIKNSGLGAVVLTVTREVANVLIMVRDNGPGIVAEKVRTLLDEDQGNHGVGIKNIQRRLKMYYGSKLEIISAPGETIFSFRLPLSR